MVETFRAFVAVDVGALPGVASLVQGLRALGADLKLVEPENAHLTVKFLGETDVSRAREVVDAMRESTTGIAAFVARLEGVGTFGPRGDPRVVWLGLREAEPLVAIAKRLDDALAKRGLAEREKRAFKPHVTLARGRSPRGARDVEAFARAHGAADAGALPVSEIRLMRSDLAPGGPTYTLVERVPLEGA